MNNLASIVFEGPPVPLARPRVTKNGTYDPQREIKDTYFKNLLLQKGNWKKIEGPIEMVAYFFMPIPASASKKTQENLLHKKHTKKPDLSNLIKFVEDVLEGVVFDNDSQIVTIFATKQYSDVPRTCIRFLPCVELSANATI
jgi:Holliday junction resolvase RusA-like endonuclease